MAWKVYGFMEGRAACGKTPALYGPLAVKRWVKVRGEKYRMRKLPAGPKPQGISSDGQKAIQYARWLARRDHLELPDGAVTVHWSCVNSPRNKRARAVTFMGNGAGQMSVLLPHWDWEPAEPIEETLSAEIVFIDMLPRGLAILAQAA